MRKYPLREKKVLTYVETEYSNGRRLCNDCGHWDDDHGTNGDFLIQPEWLIPVTECKVCICPKFEGATLNEAKTCYGEKLSPTKGAMPKGFETDRRLTPPKTVKPLLPKGFGTLPKEFNHGTLPAGFGTLPKGFHSDPEKSKKKATLMSRIKKVLSK